MTSDTPFALGLPQHQNLAYEGVHRNYAKASGEVTFAQELPPAVFLRVETKWNDTRGANGRCGQQGRS